MTSPTQRSLVYARKMGWSAAVVERWNAHAKIRQDLFGVVDLIVLGDGIGIFVQATTGAHHAKRMEKISLLLSANTPNATALRRWLRMGHYLEVWSWSKAGARGARKVWTLRREPILTYQGVPVGYTKNLETP